MDPVEVRMRCLELASRNSEDPDTIIRAVLMLEAFVLAAAPVTVASVPTSTPSDVDA